MKKRYLLIASLTAGFISFIVYVLTLAPTVFYIDSGELAAVASTLGIAHPTGYPLFTLIGYIFTLLPIPGSEVYKLNFMSAVFCTTTVMIFFYLIMYLSSLYKPITTQNRKKSQSAKNQIHNFNINSFVLIAFAISSSLILAFSKTFWSLANSVEVYPIHAFFIVLLIYSFIKAIESNKRKQKITDVDEESNFVKINIYYILFAFLTGLSFTNHLTTILLAPACITIFVLENYKERQNMFRLLGFMTLAFIIGFSLYLYLPIRANMQPDFNWGNPYNFERFVWHVTGKQFSVWIFSSKGSLPVFIVQLIILIVFSVYGYINRSKLSNYYHLMVAAGFFILSYLILSNGSEIVQKQYNTFINSLITEYGPGIIFIGVLGIYRLSKFNIKLYYLSILFFFGCMLYSVNYDIHDIESYFLLSYMTGVIWIFFGIIYIYEIIKDFTKTELSGKISAVLSILLVFIPLSSNYSVNDESKNYSVEEYTMNVFRNIEPNGIIISSQWDFWLSASWYYNFVKNVRRDIIVVDKELMRRSWYYKYLNKHYPEFYEKSKPEIDRFLIDLDKFEHDQPYDQRSIMKSYTDMLTSFVEKNPERNVYSTWEVEQNKQEAFAQSYIRVPDGILFRLVKTSQENAYKEKIKVYDFNFTHLNKKDYYGETLMQTYNMMLTNSAYILIQQNRLEDAKKYIELALKAIPNSSKTLELKTKYNL